MQINRGTPAISLMDSAISIHLQIDTPLGFR